MVHYMQIRKNPCAAMSAEETEHISGQFSILREKMKLRTHFFQKEALQNALVGFFIELANIFMGKKELMTAPTLSRKEELLSSSCNCFSSIARSSTSLLSMPRNYLLPHSIFRLS